MAATIITKDAFRETAEGIAVGIEAIGVAVIVLGGIWATGAFVSHVVKCRSVQEALLAYRGNLGHAILLGLEFLVAADIVGTVVVDPTFGNVGVLALIIAVRTFLSFALEVEISGHWPWQRTALSKSRIPACSRKPNP